ncbi:MAG: PIG-L family deacetylase, partial [Planctomycetota bacterium]
TTKDASSVDVVVHGFRDAHLPGDWLGVKKAMGELRDVDPDLVFTHRADDLHQDHRLLGELAGQTFRDHLVLSYEIPKFDGDLGRPTLYAPCSEADLEAKMRACDAFNSQRGKQWFDDETFRGLARIRGIECNSPSRYAEAFYCRKWMV